MMIMIASSLLPSVSAGGAGDEVHLSTVGSLLDLATAASAILLNVSESTTMNVQLPTLSTSTLIAAVNDPDFDEFEMAVGNMTETKHSAIPEFEHLHQGNNCKENREPNIPYDHDADFECPPPAQKRNKTCLEPSTCNANPHSQHISSTNSNWPMHTSSGNMTVVH